MFLQNAAEIITKYNSYFITKRGKGLLQNASGVLLQNGTVFTKYSYHKMRHLLENASAKYVNNIHNIYDIYVCMCTYTDIYLASIASVQFVYIQRVYMYIYTVFKPPSTLPINTKVKGIERSKMKWWAIYRYNICLYVYIFRHLFSKYCVNTSFQVCTIALPFTLHL